MIRGALLLAPLLAQPAEPARVVLLGTGTPVPDPERSGPAVAVVVNGQAYLFDAGAGVVRRAARAAERGHLPSLEAPRLTRLFLTHLHSDHTLGYADLILTPWIMGRAEPLEVYGPKGTAAMTKHLQKAYEADIDMRTRGLERLERGGLQVKVHEVRGGPVYADANVTVQAVPVRHGSWPEAFGYRVDASGRTIVISGDTAPCETLVEACHGCDVLIHEVYSNRNFEQLSAEARRYHSSFHTSARELAALASRAKPKLLILYHQLYFVSNAQADLAGEVRQGYTGVVVSGRDLDVY